MNIHASAQTRFAQMTPLLTAAFLAVAHATHAQTVWTNAGTGNWTVLANWNNGVPNVNTTSLINNGGTAQITGAGAEADTINLGYLAGQSGTLQVTSTGTLYMLGLGVGYGGAGTLSIQNGGQVSGGQVTLGNDAAATGTATVSGTGSTLSSTGIYVGSSGDGTLNVQSGGKVRSYFDTSIADLSTASTGAVTVNGAGSELTSDQNFYVGKNGSGTLNVEAGGQVTNAYAYVGYYGVGEATVTGAGSTWNNSYLGIGNGTLDILDGGEVSNVFAGISTGTVNVDGTGSKWTAHGQVLVGSGGTGTVNIQNGGQVTNTAGPYSGYYAGFYIGSYPSNPGTGTVNVTGAGSQLSIEGFVNVGDGTLNVLEGGHVDITPTFIYYTSRIGLNTTGATGTVTVSGAGSQWNNTGDIQIGASGSGVLNVLNGGQVSTTSIYSVMVGADATGRGTATVDGTGSSLNAYYFVVGNSDGSTGTLNIQNGGTVTADGGTGYVSLASNSSASGTLNIGSANRNTTGGTLNAAFIVGYGAAVVNFNQTDNITFTPRIGDSSYGDNVAVNQRGRGTTTLATQNDYVGPTTTDAGTLRLDFSNASAPAADIIKSTSQLVAAGGKLEVVGKSASASSQSFSNLAVNAGGSRIALNTNGATSLALALGDYTAVTRAIGGTLDFSLAAGSSATFTNAPVSTTPNGWATFGNGDTWATFNGGTVGGFAGYDSTWGTGKNTDVSSAASATTAPAASSVTNSLRFHEAANNTITLSGTNVIESGGILVSGTVGNHGNTITGGSIAGSAGKDLVVNQFNTAGNLVINSNIVDNGGATGLTKSGAGTLIVNGVSSYTGPTTINEGKLVLNTAVTGDVTVNENATLGGNATIGGSLTVGWGGTLSPGNSPGTVSAGSVFWVGGGTYLWEINSANGTQGANPGWDFLSVTNTLDISATMLDPFNIDLYSLTLADVAGSVFDFNSSSSYQWKIASAGGGITGFDAQAFTLDTSNFTNPYTGTFSVTQSGNDLFLNYAGGLVVPEPQRALLLLTGLATMILRRRRSPV